MNFEKYEKVLLSYGFDLCETEKIDFLKKYEKRYGSLLIIITLFKTKAVSIELGILDTRVLENICCLKTANSDKLTPVKLDKVLNNLNLTFKILETL